MIKVLHLLGPLRPSGMERMLVTAAEHFQAENVQNIIVGQGANHPFAHELERAGYEVHAIEAAGSSLMNALAFRRLVRDLKVDVIHIHTEGNYLRTVLAARAALGIRGTLFRTVHSVFDASGFWRMRRFLQALVADRLVTSLIVPSPDVAANERSMLRQTQVIFNWVDDRFHSIKAVRQSNRRNVGDPPIALLVGNCSTIKHHELALEALSASGHRLIHLGDERDASQHERNLLDTLERSGQLVERGVLLPYHALIRADYFMMPSRHEGMSVALAEAIVAGVPALVNDVQGLQWASQIEGVSMVSDDSLAWSNAVNKWNRDLNTLDQPAPDLSAARGAREYAEAYRHVGRLRKIILGFSEGAFK